MGKRAVALAAGVLVLAGCTGTPDEPSPATRPPAAPSSTAVTPSDPATDDTDAWADLPQGPAPRIPYVAGNRLVTPHRTVTLPMRERGISGVVPVADGFLVADATFFEGTNGVDLIKHGTRVRTWPSARHCSSGSPITSADGELAAWVTVRCPESMDRTIGAVYRARASGEGEVVEPIGTGLAHVVGFLGDRVVFNRGFVGGGWVTDFRGPAVRIPHVEGIRAVSPRHGFLIGIRHGEPDVVLDARGRQRWTYPAGGLVSFSPDGTQVLAEIGRHRLVILDARDGSTTSTIDLPRGARSWSTVWETADTLLLLHQSHGRVSVVRLHADGSARHTVSTVRASGGRTPYLLLPRI